MKINRQTILINLIFIAFILPALFVIVYSYEHFYTNKQFASILNPYGLYINNYNITSTKIYLSIYNPNNYSVSIYFIDLRLQNSFGSSAIITEGNMFDNIITIYPRSSYPFILFIPANDIQTISTIEPWLKYGGYLIISLDYSSLYNNVSGSITQTIQTKNLYSI